MSRVFKFRAWDPAIQSMLDFEADALREKIWMSIMLNNSEKDGEVLMQWTGFYDSDGKEIYEGDVLVNAEEAYWRVFLDSGSGQWAKVNVFAHEDDEWMSWEPVADYPNLFKVVGNIYENPKLLTEEKE